MGTACTLHARHNVLSLCVLPPGRVTASLLVYGLKALDTEQGGSELLELDLTFPYSSSPLSLVYIVTCRVYFYSVYINPPSL